MECFNNDYVWFIHQLTIDPADTQRLIKAFEQVDKDIEGQFRRSIWFICGCIWSRRRDTSPHVRL